MHAAILFNYVYQISNIYTSLNTERLQENVIFLVIRGSFEHNIPDRVMATHEMAQAGSGLLQPRIGLLISVSASRLGGREFYL